MHIKYKLLFITLMLVALFGCDISPEGDGGNGVTISTINSFNVVDDLDGDQQLDLPIHADNSESSALFDFIWEVQSSDPYWLEIYISSNTSLDEATDDLVYKIQCGSGEEFICEHSDATTCGLHYDPTYLMETIINESGEEVEVRQRDQNDNFIIEEDHYYIRCSQSADHWLTEITQRVLIAGFPTIHDFILKVCTEEEVNCPNSYVDVVFNRS